MRMLIRGTVGLALAGGAAAAMAATSTPAAHVTAHRLQARAHAAPVGSTVPARAIIGQRVFPSASEGFALAGVGQAQYPALTTDGGRTWRIDGPQFHIDAADAPEAVSSVGSASGRTLFAYGSSAVDVTSDRGTTWWETLLPGLVVAVVPNAQGHLVAYVQQSTSSTHGAQTFQYVSRDGGRHWALSRALGGG